MRSCLIYFLREQRAPICLIQLPALTTDKWMQVVYLVPYRIQKQPQKRYLLIVEMFCLNHCNLNL